MAMAMNPYAAQGQYSGFGGMGPNAYGMPLGGMSANGGPPRNLSTALGTAPDLFGQEKDVEGYDRNAVSEYEQSMEQMRSEEHRRMTEDNPLVRALKGENVGGVQYVYGGAMSTGPQELQLCKLWRPMQFGPPSLETAVVHRVHKEDDTITVQFVPDQHRVRVPSYCVEPCLNVEPDYPEVWLKPGERPPTRKEIMEHELEKDRMREMGMPVPEDTAPPMEGGHTKTSHRRTEVRQWWGIPATTLDALRNRSIPSWQLTGHYGRHYYSSLYKNNFYKGDDAEVDSLGRVDEPLDQQQIITKHVYIPLEGPVMEQMPDGEFRPKGDLGMWAHLMHD
mmetsp:Transcript_8367/g.19712  ORF Transcript_8367/g.19712 Transcript_8367/m.19712 type:complete len:335 (-) Transcript_8367:78-1082(-)